MNSVTENSNVFFSIQSLLTEIKDDGKKSLSFLESIAKHYVSDKNKSSVKGSGNNENITINFFSQIKNFNDVRKLNLTLWNILQLVRTTPEKFTQLNEHLDNFSASLNKIAKQGFKTALTFTAIAGSMMLFNFVSLVSIFKGAIALKVLSFAVGGFIMTIVKSIMTLGIIKTFLVLRAIPEILESIGMSTLFIGVSLYLIEKIKWSAVFKLISTIIMLGIATKSLNSEAKFSTAFILISLSIAILSMGTGLKIFETIKWEAITKFVLFVGGLGIAFKTWNKTRIGLITALGLSIIMYTIALSQWNDINNNVLWKFPVFITSLGISFGLLTKMISYQSLMGYAFSVMFFAIAFFLLTDISFAPLLTLTGVLLLLGLTLRYLYNGGNAVQLGGENLITAAAKSILQLAIGLGILVYVFENTSWQSITTGFGILIGLMVSFAIVMRKINGTSSSFTFNKNVNINKSVSGKKNSPPILQFAIGLAILLLTIEAFNEISWGGAGQAILFIIAITGAIVLMNKLGGKGKTRGLFGFALGLAILLLTIDGFNELNWDSAKNLLLFIAGLGIALRLFGKNMKSMFAFSLGLLTTYLTLWLVSNSNIDYEKITYFGIAITGLVAVFWLISKFAGSLIKSSLVLILMSISLMLLIIPIKSITKNISFDTLQNVGYFVASVGMLAIMYGIISFFVLPVIIGAGVIILLSIGTILAAERLSAINGIEINSNNIMIFTKAVAHLSMELFKILPFVGLGLIAAVALIPISVSLMITATSIMVLSSIPINIDSITYFTDSIKYIIESLNKIGITSIGESLLKSVGLIPIFGSMLIGAGTISLISSIKINTENIRKFTESLNLLVKEINTLGAWDLVKTSAKSVLLLPIVTVSLASATALASIQKLDVEPNKISKYGESLNLLVSSIANVVKDNKHILTDKDFILGMNGINTIINGITSVPQAIENLANLKFGEYEVKNGKLVLVGTQPFNEDTLKRVSNNLKMIIDGLIYSMVKINNSSNLKNIDNLEIFKAVVHNFTPLVNIFKLISENELLSNPQRTNDTINGLKSFSNSMIENINLLGTKQLKDNSWIMKDVGYNVGMFFYNFKKNYEEKILQQANDIVFKFVDTLSDDSKWKKIEKNLKRLKDDFWSISKSINSIDLNKATQLNNLLYNMVDKNNSQTLSEILNELTTLVGLIQEKQESSNNTGISSLSTNYDIGNSKNSNNVEIINNKPSKNVDNQRPVEKILSDILSRLEEMNIPTPPTVQKVFVTNNNNIY